MTDIVDSEQRPSTAPISQSPLSPPELATSRSTHWWRDGLQPLLLRLHFYVGLFVGPVHPRRCDDRADLRTDPATGAGGATARN